MTAIDGQLAGNLPVGIGADGIRTKQQVLVDGLVSEHAAAFGRQGNTQTDTFVCGHMGAVHAIDEHLAGSQALQSHHTL